MRPRWSHIPIVGNLMARLIYVCMQQSHYFVVYFIWLLQDPSLIFTYSWSYFFVCLLNSLIQVIKNKRTNLPVRFKEKKMESTVCLT